LEKVKKSEQEWRQELTPEQYEVVRQKGTEAPFTSELNDVKDPGQFVCVACGQPLFDSENKFDSGTAGRASIGRWVTRTSRRRRTTASS